MDIVDLHCDLLSYLAVNPDRTPLHPEVRCSGPQLKSGNVKVQVLAISAMTDYASLLIGLKQIEIFHSLTKKYSEFFTQDNIIPAFENASAFCTEQEPLEAVFKRLESILENLTPLYISLTWNGENRFGGGCGANVGLKPDGKELLRFLSGRGIAIDFSHTSDLLAYDIFKSIDQEGLDLKVMASHSNFRSVVDHPRNLPNTIAQEIIRRKGIIGLVLYPKFLGSLKCLAKQIEYGLNLGGEKALAFGADFFFTDDWQSALTEPVGFFDEMSDSSKYPSIIHTLKNEFKLSPEVLQNLCHQNALEFLTQTQTTIKGKK